MPPPTLTWPHVAFALGLFAIFSAYTLISRYFRTLEARTGRAFEDRLSKLEGLVRAMGAVVPTPPKKAGY